jgi:hypothetical protein
MTIVRFEPKDRFSYKTDAGKEYGVAISSNEAILFKGQGGRTGRTVEKGTIPKDSLPLYTHDGINYECVHFEVTFAMDAVCLTII